MTKKNTFPSVFDASGRKMGEHELELLREVVESGSLCSGSGSKVRLLEQEFAELFGVTEAIAVSAGTAAVHCSLASIGVGPGDEVITSPLTDMGAVTPILFQKAIPIFADIDPETLNITAQTVMSKITARTKAIVVTHLFGNPADIGPIIELARSERVKVIEDCAQAYLATYGGKLVGTFGDFACFSLHQTKHITCGEGGLVITNNRENAQRIRCFANRGLAEHLSPSRYLFPGLSYQMNELSAAVALAQLRRLSWVVDRRRELARRFMQIATDLSGFDFTRTLPNATHSYWALAIILKSDMLNVTAGDFSRHLRDQGIPSLPSYIGQPIFQAPFIKEYLGDGKDEPRLQNQDPTADSTLNSFPGLSEVFHRLVAIPWNENYSTKHLKAIHNALASAVDYFLTLHAYRELFVQKAWFLGGTSSSGLTSQRRVETVDKIIGILKRLLEITEGKVLISSLLDATMSEDEALPILIESYAHKNQYGAKNVGGSNDKIDQILNLLKSAKRHVLALSLRHQENLKSSNADAKGER